MINRAKSWTTNEYRPKKKFRLKSKFFLWLASGFLGLMLIGVVGVIVVFAYFSRDLPSPDKVLRHEGFATKIYDRNGKQLYDVFSDKRINPVSINQIPLTVRQATVAIEDKNFYNNVAIDPATPFRIAWNLITKRRLIGGSGLTQQLVKNTILTDERTLTRKIKEFVLTLQVQARYSKDEILQMYLNEAPYGGTAYGVEAASETYFGKPVSEVDLAESAILAGLPQSPSRYSPFVSKLYINRAKDVLRRMREDGYISSEQEKTAAGELETVQITAQSGLLKAPHFVFYVRDQLAKRYGENVVEQGGLRVTTTLDLDLQEAAQTAVAEEIDKVKHLNISNGASLVMDANNGQILAMVGSRGWDDKDVDGQFNVTTALRQPGSTIKPVTYLTGLRQGYTAATMLMDTKTSFPGGDKPEYVPENYDGKYRGPMLVRFALANSLNIPAVKMLSLVGIQDMLSTAYTMGLSSLEPTKELMSRVGLSVTLGGGEVRMIDLISAYGAFANGGKRVEPVAILKVTDSDGNVLEEWKEKEAAKTMTEQEAFIISSILSDPSARMITFGAATSLTVPNKIVAVKTGTTNDKRDNWTIGWSPKGRITAVWVGNNDNKPMKEVASGITGASPIWKRIMTMALKDLPKTEFATPSGLVAMDVDKLSGYPSHDGFPAYKEYFVQGTEPVGEDPIHKMVKVCKGEGRIATPADVSSGNYDSKEGFYFKEEDPFQSQKNWNKNAWQEGILSWLNTNTDPKYHPPTEFCGSTNPVWITIQSPGDKARVDDNDVLVKVNVDDINPIKRVDFSLDGTLKYSLTSAPWEVTIPNVANGKHKIDIKAVNEKGQEGTRFVEFAVNENY